MLSRLFYGAAMFPAGQICNCQGRALRVLVATMSKHLVSLLTTVNAPYSEQLDGAQLAYCLSDIELAKDFPGQVSSFLSEVPVAHQAGFAAEFGIELEVLKAFASEFASWSGETYKLAT